jgi:hypothetical protein
MMSEPVQDVFAMAVPDGVDPADPDLPAKLTHLAQRVAYTQYEGRPLRALVFEEMDWLITSDPADVEKFQPAHDCAACLAGNDQSLTFLQANPGRSIAMCNMAYREIW